MEDRLYADPRLAEFYDLDNGWSADTLFCRKMAETAGSVLDLGCGTGLLAAAIADGRDVVGVDPARAMLDIAAARPGGEHCTFVCDDARTVQLGRRFDLIVMTGHAFQVFLTEADRLAVLTTISAHLDPAGRVIFDSRNPATREWLEWTPDQSQRSVDHPRYGQVRAWNDIEFDAEAGTATYSTFYAIPGGETLSARSSIAFPDKAGIARLCEACGLVVERWMGDWSGVPYEPVSPEIIAVGRSVR